MILRKRVLSCLFRFYSWDTALLSVLVFFLICPSIVRAGGPVHGAKAAGMGTAFIGLADDPSALLHNPAGITQLDGSQLYGGVTFFYPTSKYYSGLHEEKTKGQLFAPPHLYATSSLGTRRFVFGLALDSLFGVGGRKWDTTGATRYLSTENTIATFSVNPVLAWRATSKLSLAVGVNYLWGNMRMVRMVDQHLVMANDGGVQIDADGDGWGYNFGLLYRFNNEWQIGMAYRSKITIDFCGDMRLTEIAPALQPLFGGDTFVSRLWIRSTFPEIYSVGLAYSPTDRLTVDTDLELVRWSSFERMEVQLARHVVAGGVVDTTTQLGWNDSWQFKVGAEFQLSQQWALRGGYAFIQQVVPELTLSPGNPDANQHNFSIGTGWSSEKLWVDLFYNFGWFEHRTIENTLLSGEYHTSAHYFGISTGYRF